MAKKKEAAGKNRRILRAGPLTKLLLLVLLLGIGWQLYRLQSQVEAAQVEKDLLAGQVEAKRQENSALAADIAAGGTQEKMEEIARNELGMVFPGEYVLCDGIDCPAPGGRGTWDVLPAGSRPVLLHIFKVCFETELSCV